jgi:hypothetical protein
MSKFFQTTLVKKNPKGSPKKFDMVSSDEKIVGDAKFLTLVRGKKTPSAKLMEIAGHVWLLEKVSAGRRFLVFGNQSEVPKLWLRKYAQLVQNVEFYFIDETGTIEKLN